MNVSNRINCKIGLCGFCFNDFSSVCHKMGCFKRKTLEYYQEQEEEAELNTGTPTKSDQSLEDKTLLEENCLPTTIEVEKD